VVREDWALVALVGGAYWGGDWSRSSWWTPMPQRVFENRQVRASRLVMVVMMARWTMAWWWSGLVS
jgi:hypothetical protein